MSEISDILGQIDIADLAKQVGASQKDTKTAATQVITSLLGGMSANVADGGEEALASALQDHKGKKTVKVDAVDTEDGAKIVEHVLGSDPDKAAAAVAKKTGTDQSLLSKLLPILAPIVIAYLANRFFNKDEKPAEESSSSSVLGDIVGSVLGNVGGGSSRAKPKSNDLGGLLGGLLGNSIGSGNSASSAGGIGDLLGKLF